MTLQYLVDTDWAIDHLNQVDRVVEKLKEMRPQGLAVSIISLAELYEGVYYSREPAESQAALDAFLDDVAVLGVDEEICKHSLTVLTNNRRHFEMVEGLRIISI